MIMVTGANGALGGEIVTSLLKITTADNLVASARDPQTMGEQQSMGIEIRQVDYDDTNTLSTAFEGIQVLVLVPSAAPIEQRMQQNRDVIAAAKASGVSRIVFLSFMDVGEDSPLPYAKAFADTEKALAESGVLFTNLRMALYMDNFLDWPLFQVRNGSLSLAMGDARLAYVSRTDLADAAAAVALKGGHDGKTYDMTGPASLSFDEVSAVLSEVRGETIRYNRITEEEHYALAVATGMPEYLCKGSMGMVKTCKQGVFDRVTSHIENIISHPPEDFLSFMTRYKDKKVKVKMS